jgi:hypothetical protein
MHLSLPSLLSLYPLCCPDYTIKCRGHLSVSQQSVVPVCWSTQNWKENCSSNVAHPINLPFGVQNCQTPTLFQCTNMIGLKGVLWQTLLLIMVWRVNPNTAKFMEMSPEPVWPMWFFCINTPMCTTCSDVSHYSKIPYPNTHGTEQVSNYLQIIRWYLHWRKFLQVISCYCSYTWSVQLIREVFHFNTSFICWFRVIRVLFSLLESSQLKRLMG